MDAKATKKTSLRLPRVACLPLVAMLLLAGIPLGIVAFTDVEPAVRQIFPFDATVMQPIKDSTVETIEFIIPGFFFSLIALAATEFYLMHPQLPRQLQLDNFVQALVHLFVGFVAHICVQQVSAVWAGKPRPSFLSACQPDITASAALGTADSAAQSITVDDCTADRDMDDFLKSFPSGHASSAVFLTMYPLIYSLYSRLVRVNLTKRYKESSRLIWDVRLALMNGFNAFVIATAWYIGLSRYIDNKHSIEDIMAGNFLGIGFAAWATTECFIAQRSIAARHSEDTKAPTGARTSSGQELHAYAPVDTASPVP